MSSGGSSGNSFDQSLNTTDSPTFGGVKIPMEIPSNLAAGTTGTGGDWPDGTYKVALIALDVNGGATAPSNELTVVIADGTTVPLTWDVAPFYYYEVVVGTVSGVYTKHTPVLNPFVVLGEGDAAWSALIAEAPPTPNTAFKQSSGMWWTQGGDLGGDGGIAGIGGGNLLAFRTVGTGAESEGGGGISLWGAGGTTTAPTDVEANQGVGRISFAGLSGVLSEVADMRAIVSTTPTPYTFIPSYLAFRVNGAGNGDTAFYFAESSHFGAMPGGPEFALGNDSVYVTMRVTDTAELTFAGSDDGTTPADLVVTGAVTASDFILSDGTSVKGDVTTAHTYKFSVYDNNSGPAYVDWATVTNGNTPSVVIAAPAGGTTLTVGGLNLTTAVSPASSGTRFLCISTTGVVTSSASACSGT